MNGIPRNKPIASLYIISIIIRSLFDMVPDKTNHDEPENTQVHELGLMTRSNRGRELKARILRKKLTLLDFISWALRGTALSNPAAVILWLAIRSLKPLEKRVHIKRYPWVPYIIFGTGFIK